VAINNAPNVRRYNISSVKFCISGAAPLPVEVAEEFEKLTKGRLIEGYGLTEAAPVTHANPFKGQRRVGTIGVPLPNTEARITDLQSGEDLPPGEVGEIVGRGPSLMAGYFGRPDLTAQAIRDGWLFTGDLGYTDDEGYLYLVDRKKDMIDSGGVKIYPKDIEEVAVRHPAVKEVAVFGVAHEKWGETPVAAVLLREGVAAGADELRDWINERVGARYQRLHAVQILDDFPRNAAGKTLKRTMRDAYREATDGDR